MRPVSTVRLASRLTVGGLLGWEWVGGCLQKENVAPTKDPDAGSRAQILLPQLGGPCLDSTESEVVWASQLGCSPAVA